MMPHFYANVKDSELNFTTVQTVSLVGSPEESPAQRYVYNVNNTTTLMTYCTFFDGPVPHRFSALC